MTDPLDESVSSTPPALRPAPGAHTFKEAPPAMKACRACRRTLAVGLFYANARTRDGLASWCRACTDASARRSAQSDAGRARLRAYWKAHRAAHRGTNPSGPIHEEAEPLEDFE